LPTRFGSGTIDTMTQAEPQHVTAEAPGRSPFAEQSSPFAEQLRVPQFGILHLMIWTAVTAVLLKYYLAVIDESQFQQSVIYLWAARITQCLHAILLASTLVGSGVLIRARCYRMFSRLQPGHWFVLLFAFVGITYMAIWPLYRLLPAAQTIWLYLGSLVLINAPMTGIYVWVIARWHGAKRWKLLMGTIALEDAITAALAMLMIAIAIPFRNGSMPYYLTSWIEACAAIGAAAFLLLLPIVVILDLARRASRDWLHWLGIACYGLGAALTVAWHVYSTFFSRIGA
jgi:hypothetical protein